ncbi:hypothetical protein EIP86_005370 [Pleurotus ostreatoroseus]|nr:hypothetical protein EIP86_005370 [Pleurotus ostreatoroseus]
MSDSSLRQRSASFASSEHNYHVSPKTTKSTDTPQPYTTETNLPDGPKASPVSVAPVPHNEPDSSARTTLDAHIPMREKFVRASQTALRASARALDNGDHMASAGRLADWVFLQGALHALDGTFDFDVEVALSMICNEMILVGLVQDPWSVRVKGRFASAQDVFLQLYDLPALTDNAGVRTSKQFSEMPLWERLCEELDATYSAPNPSLMLPENGTVSPGIDARRWDTLRDALSSPPARSIAESSTSNGCVSGPSTFSVDACGIGDPNPSGSLYERIQRLTVAVSNETHRALQSGDIKLWARCAVGYAHLQGALQGLDQALGFDVKGYISTIYTLARGAGCDVEHLAPVFTSIEDVFTYLIIHPSIGVQDSIDKALSTLLSRPCEQRAALKPALISRISPSPPMKLSHHDTYERNPISNSVPAQAAGSGNRRVRFSKSRMILGG